SSGNPGRNSGGIGRMKVPPLMALAIAQSVPAQRSPPRKSSPPDATSARTSLMMKTCTLFAAAALVASPALSAPVVAPVLANDLPSAVGLRMTAQTVPYAPGAASGSHRHAPNGFLIAYVVKGHIRSQVDGEPERVYGPGDSWTEGPNAHHLVSRNASATEAA